MNNQTQQIIQERLALLPAELQNIVTQADWIDEVKKIGEKHNLTVSQLDIYQTEVMLLLLGLIHPDMFEKDITKQLDLSEGRIIALVHDTNEKILSPIREQLKDTYLQFKKGEKDQKAEDSLTTKRRTESMEIESTTTDHSIRTQDHDPYHEPIEEDM